MAIVISSLTPINPVVTAGSTVTFNVSATDTTTGQPLDYEWQFSTNGGLSYSNVGLFNNTSATFTTSPLSQNQSGIYYRVRIQNQSGNEVVFSNEVQSIGDRIVVITAAPLIVVANQYLPSYVIPVASNLNLSVEVFLSNVDISIPNNYNSLGIEWQQSANNGDTWTTVNSGTFGQFTYNIVTATTQVSTSPSVYAKTSTLTLSNITFASNNYRYRARLTYTGASNTPTIVPETVLVVNPTISIFQQPGINANDTKLPVQCYKTSIVNSGSLRVSVGAFTTAGQNLAYSWEYSTINDEGVQSEWNSIESGVLGYIFILKPGTSFNSDVLELQRVVYFEKLGFRCTISGSVGEVPVTSDPYYLFMKDIVVQPTALSNKESLEDYYDPAIVPNNERYLYTQYPIQTVEYEISIDIARNTGLNGTVTLQFQIQSPGSSTWQNIGNAGVFPPAFVPPYTATPSNNETLATINYKTLPLRVNLDNQSQYRVQVTSTSLYTLSNGVKTLTPFYSNVSTLTVYRVVYIVTSPSDSTIFPTQNTSFLVGATTTSTAPITYQWQDAVSLTSGWSNITNGGIYSGATTNLLLLTSVPANLTRRFFRCIVSTTGALSPATSFSARLNISRDSFTSIDSLNDYNVNEFSSVSWTINPQSLSLGPILFQWQKSINFSQANPTAATWTNISGETTNTLSFPSVIKATNEGYYRCRITSKGGTVAFTNAARLSIALVKIEILLDIPTSVAILEGAQNQITFRVLASPTVNSEATYQWQIKRTTDSTFVDLGLGYLNQLSTGNSYIPPAFNRLTDNGAKIRCAITSEGVPGVTYSNECNITVNRRFYYFADISIKNAFIDGNFSLNLNPFTTGGIPTFQWQRSIDNGSTWSNISGETSSELFIGNITSSINNYQYRCQVTLTQCTQFQYSRNNVVTIQSVNQTDFTVPVTLRVLNKLPAPKYYSKEIAKNGAAIGTVICVSKPGSYINDTSSNIDDITLWKTSITGNPDQSGATSSLVSSGSVYVTNKPSWVTDVNYQSPKWLLSDDRFPGFIELRGQWLVKSEFALLYKVIGDTYGSTETLFRLPNPYGKKLMGTGNVNNNGGNVSVIPLYEPNGTSGGDKNLPGSIGGVWNYIKSAQLPPGSPGDTSQPDGTAGVGTAETLTLGNYTTTGFTDCEGLADTNFSGRFTWTVGPLLSRSLYSPPPHTHFGISAGFTEGFRAYGGSSGCCEWIGRCNTIINPGGGQFWAVINSSSGEISRGPEGIDENDRGIPHSHSLGEISSPAGNGGSNHNELLGDTPGQESVVVNTNLQVSSASDDSSLNMFLESAPINLTNASAPIFNSSLKFYLKNNEEMPVNSSYFRLKYMIKAY
jgi:hypothetical protein